MEVILTPAHWLFLFWVIVVIAVMGFRKDPLIPCILGLLTVGYLVKHTVVGALTTVYNGFIVAGNEFWGIIVVISLIVALSRLLSDTGADYLVMSPAAKLMINGNVAYWVLGFSMLIASWFFWPSPATALVGAIMFPVAVRAGLPAMGCAMAMNLFGHGIGLSTDYVIQGAPTITAKAAGFADAGPVIWASVPLIITMSIVTTVVAFIMIKKDMVQNPEALLADQAIIHAQEVKREITRTSYILAWLTPLAFAADVAAMYFLKLRGGDATALLGATAVVILVIGTILKYGWEGFGKVSDYIKDGFLFGIKIFAPVIIIAGFFFLGKGDLAKTILDIKTQTGFLEDFGLLLSQSVVVNKALAALVTAATGMIVGLDGSGFSPLPLVGSLAATFGTSISTDTVTVATDISKAVPIDKATLAALGQIAGVWTGGGTLIPWALIPVAAITGVNPIELARKNFIPVISGLIATTIVAILIM